MKIQPFYLDHTPQFLKIHCTKNLGQIHIRACLIHSKTRPSSNSNDCINRNAQCLYLCPLILRSKEIISSEEQFNFFSKQQFIQVNQMNLVVIREMDMLAYLLCLRQPHFFSFCNQLQKKKRKTKKHFLITLYCHFNLACVREDED